MALNAADEFPYVAVQQEEKKKKRNNLMRKGIQYIYMVDKTGIPVRFHSTSTIDVLAMCTIHTVTNLGLHTDIHRRIAWTGLYSTK